MPFIPFPPGATTPVLNPVPYAGLDIQILKDLTHWFIMQDPTDVVLIPQAMPRTDNGGTSRQLGAARDPQTVKFVFQLGDSDGVNESQDGQERKYPYIMVMEWDAVVAINDQWHDPSGQFWIVKGLSPYNGYEVKAEIMSFGKAAING